MTNNDPWGHLTPPTYLRAAGYELTPVALTTLAMEHEGVRDVRLWPDTDGVLHGTDEVTHSSVCFRAGTDPVDVAAGVAERRRTFAAHRRTP